MNLNLIVRTFLVCLTKMSSKSSHYQIQLPVSQPFSPDYSHCRFPSLERITGPLSELRRSAAHTKKSETAWNDHIGHRFVLFYKFKYKSNFHSCLSIGVVLILFSVHWDRIYSVHLCARTSTCSLKLYIISIPSDMQESHC